MRRWTTELLLATVTTAGVTGCAMGQAGSGDTEAGGLASATEGTTTGTLPAGGSTSSASTTSTSSSTSTSAEGSSGDEGGSTGCTEVAWWADRDDDGFGDPASQVLACEAPVGYTDNDADCDDASDLVHPSADETCDGIDNDCDGLLDEYSVLNETCNGCLLFEIDDHVYAACEGPATWDDARGQCANLFGGDLAVIGDELENSAIIDRLGPLGSGPQWYIGLTDAAEEGNFVWIDGTAPMFTFWDDGEPNDLDGEDCGEIRAVQGYTWNDSACGQGSSFLCESPPP